MFLAQLVLVAAIIPQDRIAISHDGNHHDSDDIGAIAMAEALLWQAGRQSSLVHLDHSSHRGGNTPPMQANMILSATRWATHYGLNLDVIMDDFLDLRASVLNLAAAIEASSSTDRLTMIQGGPWEIMALAFDNSDPATHQYVDIVSHSTWNDGHQHLWYHRNKSAFFAQYGSGGDFAGVTPPTYTKIDDQNSFAFKSGLSSWTWLNGSLNTWFVLQRTSAAGSAAGDMSDAGMVFWYLTGIEHPTMQDVRDFFGL